MGPGGLGGTLKLGFTLATLTIACGTSNRSLEQATTPAADRDPAPHDAGLAEDRPAMRIPGWLGAPTVAVAQRTMRHAARPVVAIDYPHVAVDDATLQARLDDAVETPLRKRADEFVKAYAYNASLPCIPAGGGSTHPCGEFMGDHELRIECVAGLATTKIISIGCGIFEDIGPPHPLHSHTSFNFVLEGNSARALPLEGVLRGGIATRTLLAKQVGARLSNDANAVERALGDYFLTREALVAVFPMWSLGSREVLVVDLAYPDIVGLLAPSL
jgi:hypothetical protein